jgi:two-component system, sensor histidine kinase
MIQNSNTMKPKILIVDDLPENLLALEKLLEDLDVEFVRAFSGNEGLIKALKDDFALAIIDVQMPGMDGFEMVSILHESRKTRHIPVVFVSAIYRKTDHIVRGIESGAIDFISKPINDDVLRGKVKIFVEMYHQRKERENLIQQLELTRENLELQKAKAENATRAKTMFLASMSHEIRTPLNGIIGMIEILKNTHSRDKYEEYLEIIEISADNLLNIINDILDFSKIESDQIELEAIPLSIREEVSNVVKLLQLKASSKGLEFSASIDKDVPQSLIGDPVRFRQILLNLANNAIKFTEKGFIKIHLKNAETKDEVAYLHCSVADSGIGISAQGKERLFHEFSQSERSTTRKYGGSGLGLAISKKLTELMRGEIGVDSELGKGSKFWFTFQMKISDDDVLQKSKKPKVSQSPSKSLDILLVDDNAINRKVALFTLQKLGHRVESVENGKLAVDAFKTGNFDVILMDIQMPVMDGYQATAEIRDLQKDEAYANSKIVAMTANAEKGEMEKCLELGMDSYISKPFKSESLEEVIQNVMQL